MKTKTNEVKEKGDYGRGEIIERKGKEE